MTIQWPWITCRLVPVWVRPGRGFGNAKNRQPQPPGSTFRPGARRLGKQQTGTRLQQQQQQQQMRSIALARRQPCGLALAPPCLAPTLDTRLSTTYSSDDDYDDNGQALPWSQLQHRPPTIANRDLIRRGPLRCGPKPPREYDRLTPSHATRGSPWKLSP